MDKKSQKAYEKAMNLYESGEIEKALDICENVLSEELNNAEFLNFKGLLLYQQGKLKEAVTVWKLNEEFNKDTTAIKYIKDSASDFEKLNTYRDGERALRNLNVDLALNLFSTCALSDFNLIKVNTGLAICYQKKGKYNKALEHIDKVLKVDRNYEEALRLKKEISEFSSSVNNKKASKKILTFVTIIFAVVVLCGAGFAVYMRITNEQLFNSTLASILNSDDKDKDAQEENVKEKSEPENDKDEKAELPAESENLKKANETEENSNKEENNEKSFDVNKVQQLINTNNVDELCEELQGINKDSISSDSMYIYRQAIDLINQNGVFNYYNNGLEFYNQKNYEKAQVEFDKAYEFCQDNSYKEHIVFYRANNLMQMAKTDEAIKEYEEYYAQYPKGVYTEGVLYELILIYEASDKNKSTQYARELVNNFPQSIYINDNVLNLLNN